MVFMDNRNMIGKKIREIREKQNMSQEQLSTRLITLGIDIDRSMISRIESQTRYILDYELYAIALILNVTIEELFSEVTLNNL
jgi:transcriptional regulator with XRE-family HTH domain